jgi:hypothetical protein
MYQLCPTVIDKFKRGIFVMECRSESSFSEKRKLEQRSRTFYPGIGIANTTPLRSNFGLLFIFHNPFQKKNR